jgi:hypothetical protein
LFVQVVHFEDGFSDNDGLLEEWVEERSCYDGYIIIEDFILQDMNIKDKYHRGSFLGCRQI